MTGPVVVGLDGSPAGITAAWWAAHEATARHLPVVLLHSWTSQPLNVPTLPQEARSKERYGREILNRTEAELLHRFGDLALTTELVSAPAAQELVDRSKDASLLVLGSRGHGSLASFVLGSISLRVLGLAHGPAVTVRAGDPVVEDGWGHPAPADRDEVVVGVREPGPAADPVLEFAFIEAASGGTPLRVLRVLPEAGPVPRPHPRHIAAHRGSEAEATEQTRLAAAVAPWRRKFPGVPVTQQVVTGHPSQVLLTAAAHGRLLVVGRRRHPSHLTWRLGPVAHAALHHVPTPVAVVPHD
ncbi:universal stress protein [Streptomyces brasiliscabiei]|uniref:Universal stress protein n=1 Tax=Streptomyces brasiliscabiei TaxID=2736302 RepID=A0ABU8GCU3_9ACTN